MAAENCTAFLSMHSANHKRSFIFRKCSTAASHCCGLPNHSLLPKQELCSIFFTLILDEQFHWLWDKGVKVQHSWNSSNKLAFFMQVCWNEFNWRNRWNSRNIRKPYTPEEKLGLQRFTEEVVDCKEPNCSNFDALVYFWFFLSTANTNRKECCLSFSSC